MKFPFLAARHRSEFSLVMAMNFMLGKLEVPVNLNAMKCFQIDIEGNPDIFIVKRTVSQMIEFPRYSKVSSFCHLRSIG
jgi:hypothetical protein